MIKDFLKPNLKKIIIFIILLVLGFILNQLDISFFILDPITTIIKGVPCAGGYCSELPLGFITLILFYILSCLIAYFLRGRKK